MKDKIFLGSFLFAVGGSLWHTMCVAVDNGNLPKPNIEVHTAWCGFHTTVPVGCYAYGSIDIISHRDNDKGTVIVSKMNAYKKTN